MTWRFLVDEDMPRSTARILPRNGYHVEDVRDVGLRGHSDQDVFAYAQTHGEILVTADKGFADLLRFRLGSRAGIVVVRVPDELPTPRVNHELVKGLASLAEEDLVGILVVVEVNRVRIRRPV